MSSSQNAGGPNMKPESKPSARASISSYAKALFWSSSKSKDTANSQKTSVTTETSSEDSNLAGSRHNGRHDRKSSHNGNNRKSSSTSIVPKGSGGGNKSSNNKSDDKTSITPMSSNSSSNSSVNTAKSSQSGSVSPQKPTTTVNDKATLTGPPAPQAGKAPSPPNTNKSSYNNNKSNYPNTVKQVPNNSQQQSRITRSNSGRTPLSKTPVVNNVSNTASNYRPSMAQQVAMVQQQQAIQTQPTIQDASNPIENQTKPTVSKEAEVKQPDDISGKSNQVNRAPQRTNHAHKLSGSQLARPPPVNAYVPSPLPDKLTPQQQSPIQQMNNTTANPYPMYYEPITMTYQYMPLPPFVQNPMQFQRPMYLQQMQPMSPYPIYGAPRPNGPNIRRPEMNQVPPILPLDVQPNVMVHSRSNSTAAINEPKAGATEFIPLAKREKKVIAIINPETHEQLKFSKLHSNTSTEIPEEAYKSQSPNKFFNEPNNMPIMQPGPQQAAIVPPLYSNINAPMNTSVINNSKSSEPPLPANSSKTLLTEEEKKRRQQEAREQLRRRIEEARKKAAIQSPALSTVSATTSESLKNIESIESPKVSEITSRSSEGSADNKTIEAPIIDPNQDQGVPGEQTDQSKDKDSIALESVISSNDSQTRSAKECTSDVVEAMEELESAKDIQNLSVSSKESVITENKSSKDDSKLSESESDDDNTEAHPKVSQLSKDEGEQDEKSTRALEAARYIDFSKATYPDGIQLPKASRDSPAPTCIRYEREFLIQFQSFCKFKPTHDWERIIQNSIGNLADAGRRSMKGSDSKSKLGGSLGSNSMHNFNFEMGKFGTGRPGSNSFSSGFGKDDRSSQGQRNISQSNRKSRSNNPSRRANDSKRGQDEMKKESDIAPLVTSENRWKPRQKEVEPGPDDHLSPDMVQRKVKGALNKMTPDNFDKLSDKILEIALQSKNEQDGRTLRQVIELTFEKATDESNYSNMYAQFCLKMMDKTDNSIKDEQIIGKDGEPICGGLLFRKYLLSRCQEQFEKGWKRSVTDPENEQEKDASNIELLTDDYYIAAAAKRRGLGLVQFVGELFKFGMLTRRIMLECITRLLGNIDEPEEEEVESLCRLMRTVGQILDEDPKTVQAMQAYIERMQLLRHSQKLSSRIRFMIQDIIDLRENRWQHKEADKGPKTISEIHADAEKAREAAALAAAASQSRNHPRGMKGDSGSERNRLSIAGRQSSTSSLDGWSKNSSRFGQLRLDKQQSGSHTPSTLMQNMMRSHSGSRQSAGNQMSKATSSSKSTASQNVTNMYDILDSHHETIDAENHQNVDSNKH